MVPAFACGSCTHRDKRMFPNDEPEVSHQLLYHAALQPSQALWLPSQGAHYVQRTQQALYAAAAFGGAGAWCLGHSSLHIGWVQTGKNLLLRLGAAFTLACK